MTLSAVRRKTVSLPLDPLEYDELWDELAEKRVAIQRLR
jgi:hypothetical protein